MAYIMMLQPIPMTIPLKPHDGDFLDITFALPLFLPLLLPVGPVLSIPQPNVKPEHTSPGSA